MVQHHQQVELDLGNVEYLNLEFQDTIHAPGSGEILTTRFATAMDWSRDRWHPRQGFRHPSAQHHDL